MAAKVVTRSGRILIALDATTLIAGSASSQTAITATPEIFVTVKPTDVLSDNLIGLNVTNQANEMIGEIKDLILSNDALIGYIVSVGGFLPIGERLPQRAGSDLCPAGRNVSGRR